MPLSLGPSNFRSVFFRLALTTLILLLLLLFFRSYWASKQRIKEAGNASRGSPGKVLVEVYYEVLCPDSRYFLLHQFYPAWQKIGPDHIDVRFKPFGKASYRHSPRETTFSCQHGPTECLGNMVHACAVHHVTDTPNLVDYLHCMMNDNYDPMAAGKKCAEQLSLSNWSDIESCSTGRQGQQLLAEHGDDTHKLRPKVSFIPTIVLDGSQDEQKGVLKNFQLELCRKIEGPQPANCLEIL